MLPDEIKKADVTAKWWSIQEDIKLGKATPQQMAEDVLATVRSVISSGKGSVKIASTCQNGGNEKTEPVISSVQLSAKWVSPDPASKLWGNSEPADDLVIKCGNTIVTYSQEPDGTISR